MFISTIWQIKVIDFSKCEANIIYILFIIIYLCTIYFFNIYQYYLLFLYVYQFGKCFGNSSYRVLKNKMQSKYYYLHFENSITLQFYLKTSFIKNNYQIIEYFY